MQQQKKKKSDAAFEGAVKLLRNNLVNTQKEAPLIGKAAGSQDSPGGR